MEMIPVSSSNLESVGYDTETKTLKIKFHNGLYEYYNVPESIYHGLINASSKGKYHAAFIKNSYSYQQL